MTFSLSFSPQSLKEITAFAGFPALLSSEVQSAMSEGGTLLANAAIANTWSTFKNPSGELASTIAPLKQTPYEIMVGADTPYAHRREYGFKGPDSLGRMFPNDPAAHYMTNALNDNQQAVLQLIDDAVDRALTRLSTG